MRLSQVSTLYSFQYYKAKMWNLAFLEPRELSVLKGRSKEEVWMYFFFQKLEIEARFPAKRRTNIEL